jgi:hypothetical protein
MKPRCFAFAVAMFAAGVAQAQIINDVTTTVALNNSSGTCFPSNGARKTLIIDNTGNSVNVGYCETPITSATPCTPAIGTAGTTTLGQTWAYWIANSVPQNQFCFIAASGTPSITIREGTLSQ